MVMGKPCSRCGACCREELCGLALTLLQDVQGPPCPALEFDGQDHACGLVAHPQKYVDVGAPAQWKHDWLHQMFADMLGIGRGCDMTMANW